MGDDDKKLNSVKANIPHCLSFDKDCFGIKTESKQIFHGNIATPDKLIESSDSVFS